MYHSNNITVGWKWWNAMKRSPLDDLMRKRREWWVSKKSEVSVWSLTWNSSWSTGNDKTWIGIIEVFDKNCCYTDRNKDRIELEEKSTDLKYLWIHRDVFLCMSFSDVLLYVYDGPLVSHWLLSQTLSRLNRILLWTKWTWKWERLASITLNNDEIVGSCQKCRIHLII